MAIPAELFDRRLLLVSGKGGVGRTTIAAALAASAAAQGKKTLLYQANASEKMAQLLDGVPSSPTITRVRENLYTVNTNAEAALHEYGLMILKFETVYKMVFENRIAKSLLRAIPGLDEYSILGKLWFHTTETERNGKPRWDLIIFDTPATGHLLSMLHIPDAIHEAVPEGPLTRDATHVRAMLRDRTKTGVVLVTLAEEMPAVETMELCGKLERDLQVPVIAAIANQVYPDRFPEGSPQAQILDRLCSFGMGGVDDPELARMVSHAQTMRSRRDMNEQHLSRLRRELPVPLTELPLLFAPHLGAAQIAELARYLAPERTSPL